MRKFGALLAVLLMLVPIGAHAAPATSEWQVLSSFDPRLVHDWARSVNPDENGAIGLNRRGYSDVQYQRETVYRIPQGVLHHDTALVASSVRMMDYAFAHQNSDGSFVFHEGAGATASGFPADTAAAAAAAFFMYDMCHSVLLLQQSDWFEKSADTAALRAHLQNDIVPKTKAALSWLDGKSSALEWDNRAANRLLTYGTAYYMCGAVTGDSQALALGRHFIGEGLDKQSNDGALVEAGGFDSSYQGVSLYLLDILYLQMLPADSNLRSRIWAALGSGTAREIAAITPGGDISVSANSRVKQASHVDHGKVLLALEYYAILSGNSNVKAVAQRVLAKFG